jgi:NAD(P)-dependent dehydrogenase (short-subunit alcohol dehydrogenase family)
MQGRFAIRPCMHPPMSLLARKIAIVTGAASGIGRAGAYAFATADATVVVADIDRERGERVAREIGGGRAQFQPVDVRDTLQVQRMAANTVARFGRIDVLFHNAMNVPLVNRYDGRATELPEQTWHEIVDLVLNGTFYCCKYVGQQMLRQKSGSIILTATTDALIGQAGIDAYTAAKGGVVAMTRSLAAGLSPEGVRVNAICPGFVETPHQAPFMSDPAERKKLEDLHLMGILQPEDIADFATFLASDKAKRVTGGVFPVDAGYTAFKGLMSLKETIAR